MYAAHVIDRDKKESIVTEPTSGASSYIYMGRYDNVDQSYNATFSFFFI